MGLSVPAHVRVEMDPGSFARWLQQIADDLRDDRDCVIIFTGRERSGKSTASFLVGMALSRLLGREYDTDDICFSMDDLKKRAILDPKGRVLCLDEIIDGAYRRAAMQRTNKDSIRFAIVMGVRNHVITMNAPRLDLTDSYFAGHRATYWIHIPTRGVMECYSRANMSQFADKDKQWWNHVGTWKFPAAKGPKWNAYLQSKESYVEKIGLGNTAPKDAPPEPDTSPLLGMLTGASRERVVASIAAAKTVLQEIRAWRPPTVTDAWTLPVGLRAVVTEWGSTQPEACMEPYKHLLSSR